MSYGKAASDAPSYPPAAQPGGGAPYPYPPAAGGGPSGPAMPSQPPPYYPAGGSGGGSQMPQPQQWQQQAQPAQMIFMPQQPPLPGRDGGDNNDSNNNNDSGFAFSDKSLRLAFIRKVYLILCAQLAVTFGVVLLVSLVPALRNFALANSWLFHLGYIVFLVVYICLVCTTSLRRKHPWNFVALGIFTAALTLVTAVISARYKTNSVLICLGVTVLVCLGVTLFAVQTRVDFTLCSGLLFGLSLVVLLFGLACTLSFFAYRGYPGNYMTLRILDCVYGGLVALLLVLFLIYDTQRVVGGRQHNLSEEEYVFGALQLYMDVVFIFIIILGLGGNR